MERRIEVQVAVSSNEHAKIIRDEIEALVRLRTTIYVVTHPMRPKCYIPEIKKAAEECA